jgi:phosphate:Na+ symporter
MQLLGIGILMTTVLQSSSAGVATALTALHAGTLSFPQAAALVIGINIGTTVTAGLAAIGASTAAKRTAFAHLLFNTLTGVVAFVTLPAFVAAVARLGEQIAPGDATVMLATFHTAFNVLGVALVLPFTKQFSAMVVRVIRHRGPDLTRRLDPAATAQGSMAMEAVRRTLVDILASTLGPLRTLAGRRNLAREEADALEAAAQALHDTEQYVAALHFSTPVSVRGQQRHVSTIHALDHLGQLIEVALGAPSVPSGGPRDSGELRRRMLSALDAVQTWVGDPHQLAPVQELSHLHDAARDLLQQRRNSLLSDVASDTMLPSEASQRLEALGWIEHLTHHLHRLVDRLSQDGG